MALFRSIKGRFTGSVVELDEPAPVTEAVTVLVQFPLSATPEGSEAGSRFHWATVPPAPSGFDGSVSEELIRQRQQP